jgi:glycosyltransferase involved in cell wall biosynthesis
MKILHINTYDTGGAANACLRIHLSLLDKGIDSKVLVLYKSRDIPEVYEFNYWDNTKNRLHRFIKRRIYKRYSKHMDKLNKFIQKYPVEIFTEPTSIFDITTHPLYKEADIIQLNWTAGFLDEPSFFAKNKKPVIWRMSDLYICSGGYHYEKGFLFNDYKKLLHKNNKVHRKSLENKKINIVAISDWTKQKALNCSFLKDQSITVIHNGIDTDIYLPHDKQSARESLSIPLDKKVILIGAQSLSNPRKGSALLLEAIKGITDNSVLFYGFGSNKDLDNRISSLGFIKDEKLLAKIYSAADLFIMSSIEEAFGQVFIESLACGTPVISFPNGGALDIIKNGINGFLSEDFTSKSLLYALYKGLDTNFDKNAIRDDIIKRFNIKNKADEYIKLYKNILGK